MWRHMSYCCGPKRLLSRSANRSLEKLKKKHFIAFNKLYSNNWESRLWISTEYSTTNRKFWAILNKIIVHIQNTYGKAGWWRPSSTCKLYAFHTRIVRWGNFWLIMAVSAFLYLQFTVVVFKSIFQYLFLRESKNLFEWN